MRIRHIILRIAIAWLFTLAVNAALWALLLVTMHPEPAYLFWRAMPWMVLALGTLEAPAGYDVIYRWWP